MKVCVMHPEVPISWGMSGIMCAENLKFTVNGSRMQNLIEIDASDDLLTVKIDNIMKQFHDPADALFWIDSMIEQ